MIGALNMFDVNTINAGTQAGMQRGAVNSPFTPLGQALKGTLDMYNKNRAAQQEQQYKLQQINATADAGYSKALMLQNAKYKMDSPAPIPGMEDYDITNPKVVNVGNVPHFVQPLYKNGRIVGQKLESSLPNMWSSIGGSGGDGLGQGADADVARILDEIDQQRAQLEGL